MNLNPEQKYWHVISRKFTHAAYKNTAKSNNICMSHDSGNENTIRFIYNYLEGKNQLIPKVRAKYYANI